MTLFWFGLAGFLLLLGVFLTGMKHPLFSSQLDFDLWPYVVGISSGLAGWIILWFAQTRTLPGVAVFAAVMVPLALAAVVAAWRIWAGFETLVPCGMALLPLAAVARWTLRAQWMDGVGIAIFVVAVSVVGGSAWYIVEWKDPRWKVTITEMATMGGSGEAMGPKGTFELFARVLAPRHFRGTLLPGVLCCAAVLLSFWLWRLSPRVGWLGIAGGLVGSAPPLVCWWRARGTKGFRATLLGPGAVLYDAIGAAVPLGFLVAEAGWVWFAFSGA